MFSFVHPELELFSGLYGDGLFVADETTLYGPRVLARRVSVRRNQFAGKGLRATVPRRRGYRGYHTPYHARHVLVAADIYSRDRVRPTSVVRRPIRVRAIYNIKMRIRPSAIAISPCGPLVFARPRRRRR